jgi:hypothetical protein
METLEQRLQKRIHVSLYALLFLTTLLGLSVLLEGCSEKCQVTNEYVYYEPVYSTVQEIREGVHLLSPQAIHSVGKIYFKDGYLFLNEPGAGIHIIDDRNPSIPAPVRFLQIPGNYDMAIRDNTLYADSYVDLVAFDISNPSAVREVNRLESVFRNYTVLGYSIDPDCCVITSFEEKKQVSINESDCDNSLQPWGGIMYDDGIAVRETMASTFNTKAAIAPGSGSGSGVGGSLARFTILGDHLYLLDGSDLQTIDVSNEQNPEARTRTHLAWNIETIFPYKTNLFVGSSTGMYILDVSSPENPVTLSSYSHVRSCDPVVVDDNYAYVTLRTGTTCQGFVNELQVIDITNLRSPFMVKEYPMTNPHGLGIDNKTLFVCDGDAGLKAFDASDVKKIDERMIAHYNDIHAVDVIPLNNVLMMIGEDGLYQFDYSNPANMRLLSKIELSNAL